MARVSALTGKARSEESEGKPIAGMCWLWSMERFCGCPSLFIQRTEGLRDQLHFTISVLICIQLLAPDSSLQPFSQDTPSYVSPAPVQIFMRPAHENTVGWQSCDDVGSCGPSVTRPRQEGCTQLGLTWDQLLGGQGSSRQGLEDPEELRKEQLADFCSYSLLWHYEN